MKVAVINYNAGNTQSVFFALQRLGADVFLANDAAQISKADKVIFPGVGNAKSAVSHLKKSGLYEIIPRIEVPFLGICLGLQIMCKESEEGETKGLGVFDLEVKRFSNQMRVPHMGWNTLEINKDLPASFLFEGISEEEYFYFVHSYFAEIKEAVLASCVYEDESGKQSFSAAVSKDNFYAVQFHPEKSQKAGEKLLSNFINNK